MRTDEELRELIEIPKTATLWGQEYTITPRFVPEKLGNGEKWLKFVPMKTNPDHFVIRIDSAWNVCDHYDEICEAIEAEYGSPSDEEMGDYIENQEFPYIFIEGGASWGEIEAP